MTSDKMKRKMSNALEGLMGLSCILRNVYGKVKGVTKWLVGRNNGMHCRGGRTQISSQYTFRDEPYA